MLVHILDASEVTSAAYLQIFNLRAAKQTHQPQVSPQCDVVRQLESTATSSNGRALTSGSEYHPVKHDPLHLTPSTDDNSGESSSPETANAINQNSHRNYHLNGLTISPPSTATSTKNMLSRNGENSNAGEGTESPSTETSEPNARPKPVLSEEQKKANHIQSEQKRREKIREQYDKLAELTPGMTGQGRSEGRVLEEAVKFAEVLKEERQKLIADIEARGGIVDPAMKKF